MAGSGRQFLIDPGLLHRTAERYSFSWPTAAAEKVLRDSWQSFGQLRPLLCVETAEGITVVSGQRRVEFALAAGWKEVAVRVVEPRDELRLWDLLLAEQADSRPLNPVETGVYLRRRLADTQESLEEVVKRGVLGRLGLPDRAPAAEDPLWLADLPEQFRPPFAEGRLPLQGIRVLRRATRADALAVLALLGDMRVGVNRFAELAGWIFECAWREGDSVERWLRRAAVPRMQGAAEDLRRAVRALRFPSLCEWERTFPADVRECGLPDEVRISHAQGFEGGKLTLATTFACLDELERSLDRTLAALRSGALDRLGVYLG